MTVVEPLADLNHWGILNVLCVLLPQLAPIEIETDVVMPQTKDVLYHLSNEVRAAVVGILCKHANGNRRLTLSLAMVNCWNLCAKSVLDELGDATPRIMSQRHGRFLLKDSRHLRNNSIGLLSHNIAGFPTYPEHCSS